MQLVITKRIHKLCLTEVLIPLRECYGSWQQHYGISSRRIWYRQVKKKSSKWVNMCSCWASASPDSQTATKRSSRCGHKRESIGREINSTNLPLDNTMRGWWRMKKKRRRRKEEDGSRHWENKGLDNDEMQPRGMRLGCVLVPTVHEFMKCTSPTNDRQLGISLSYLTETNQQANCPTILTLCTRD